MTTFVARRSSPEPVAPARPTPHELKVLSDVDDQKALRYYNAFVEFFRLRRPSPGAAAQTAPAVVEDPAKAIRAALAEALVHYYPMAGRLRELPGGKLAVDCAGQGVVFVEAEADVRLEQLGDPVVVPPFACSDELLCDVGDASDVLGKPLFFLQVTRLRCGGFVVGFHTCHCIADGFGMIQFAKAICDLARTNQRVPVVTPVWERQLLTARVPPRLDVTRFNPAYVSLFLNDDDDDDAASDTDIMASTPHEAMVTRYFFFGARDVAALRTHLTTPATTTHQLTARSSTSFEVLTAVLWRCRTAALGYEKDQKVRLMFTLNARMVMRSSSSSSGGIMSIPRGYFGNALFLPLVECTAGELCGRPLEHAVELVRGAKTGMNGEHMASVVDALALLRQYNPRPAGAAAMERTYLVSDIRWLGEDGLDLGWAERVGGGIPAVLPSSSGSNAVSKAVSQYMRCVDADGEESVTVKMYLPPAAMDGFAKQLDVLLNKN